MRSPNEFRTGLDPGEGGVRSWIDRWAEDSSDIAIQKFEINSPPAEELSAVLCDPMLLRARRGRDSELHAYLKYLAARWLQSGAPNAAVRYEAQVYLPGYDSLELAAKHHIHVPPRSRKPRILTPRDRDMNATYGFIIAIDVLGRDTSVEVGATQPYNLLSPMIEGLVKRAVWVPFPRELDRSKFTVNTNALQSVVAYQFTPEDSNQGSS